MKLLYFAFVAATVFYTAYAYVDYGQYVENEEDLYDIRLGNDTEDEDKNCTKPGLMCKNCQELVNCVLGENDEFEQLEIETCSSVQTCLKDQCTRDPNPICVKDYVFECTATGVFPDPFNCRKFHYCVKKQSSSNNIEIVEGIVGKTTLLCDDNFAYDPITTYCKFNLTNGCPDDKFPVPICKKSGQSGPLTNKSIYYMCVISSENKLIPKLYVCPHGKIYDNSKCV